MSGKLTAEVILRAVDGSSILDAKGEITAENIAKYRVGKEVIEEASKKLEVLGFEVMQTGPTSATISGDKALFEKVFQTTFETQSAEMMETKIVGVESTYFQTTSPIKIPADLSSLIADVVLPTPPTFYP